MDEKAQRFSEECGPYAGMVYRHCLHMLSRPEEAEDAAQESMLRAFRAYDGYRGEGKEGGLATGEGTPDRRAERRLRRGQP